MASYDVKRASSVSNLSRPHERTKHPMVCLLSGFGVIVVTALVVHFAFSLLL